MVLNKLATPATKGEEFTVLNEQKCLEIKKLIPLPKKSVRFIRVSNESDIEIVRDSVTRIHDKECKITSLTGVKSFIFNLDFSDETEENFESLEKIVTTYLKDVRKMNYQFTGPIFIGITRWTDEYLDSEKFKLFLEFVRKIYKDSPVYLYASYTNFSTENIVNKINKTIDIKVYDCTFIFASRITYALNKLFEYNKIPYNYNQEQVGLLLAKKYLNKKEYANLDKFISKVIESDLTKNGLKITNESFCNFLGKNYLVSTSKEKGE